MSTDSPSPSTSPIRRALLAILALAVIGTGVWAVLYERADDDVAASFRDAELTVADLNELLRTNPANQVRGADGEVAQAPTTADGLQAADELTAWLVVEAVLAELESRDVRVTDDQRAQVAQLAAQSGADLDTAYGQRTLRLQETLVALQEYADSVARDSAVDVPTPEWICSSHILVETEQEALDVIAELEGGMDFAGAAAVFSTGPSGPSGGDLGCSSVERLVPEFVDGARAAGAGTVSPPVQTSFGWHVIEVRAIGELTAENFPEVDAQTIDTERINAEATARQTINDQVFTEVLEAARADVGAEGFVNPQFGTWAAAQAFVAPPAGVAPAGG